MQIVVSFWGRQLRVAMLCLNLNEEFQVHIYVYAAVQDGVVREACRGITAQRGAHLSTQHGEVRQKQINMYHGNPKVQIELCVSFY